MTGTGAAGAMHSRAGQDAGGGGRAADEAGANAPSQATATGGAEAMMADQAGSDAAMPMGMDTGMDPSQMPGIVPGGVRWLGRVDDRNPDAVRFSWAGSGLTAVLKGDSLSVRLRSEGSSIYYQSVIDGMPEQRFEVAKGEHVVNLASGLDDTEHTLELYRDTEGDGPVSVFLGFEEGMLVGAPHASGRFFEIVGDSITVGYGSLGMERHDSGSSRGCDADHSNSSWFQTYEAVAARELDAEVSTIARSGFGMVRGYGQNMNVMPPLFDDTLADEDDPPWNFEREPAALIINLGTNDWNGGDPGTPFETAYIKFVTQVRDYYPNTWILLTIGPTLEDGRKRQVEARLSHVIDARTQDGDDMIDMIDIGIQDTAVTGCGWHPNIAEHMRVGMVLADELRMRLNWW